MRKFNEEMEVGRPAKPASHRNEVSRWKHFVEHDGSVLSRLHQKTTTPRNASALLQMSQGKTSCVGHTLDRSTLDCTPLDVRKCAGGS